ncbi:response regulator [Candidatus Uhrbacteria bacterium]|nr:response regulator [Candidatus Uhrbacteria bacterium]
MSSSHHICILEDDHFFAGLFARKFEARGWKTTVIEDVDDLDDCLDKGIDVLVMDIESSDGAGADLVPKLKSSPKTAAIPIVVLTKASDRSTVQKMMGHGVDAYLLKGHFVPNEVVEKVHRILESKVT